MKNAYRLKQMINPKIKVGDKVYFKDGSSITCDQNTDDKFIAIVFDYPNLTGEKRILKEIEGTVIETDVKDRLCAGLSDTMYLQDIAVQLGTGVFRTCSEMVRKSAE